MTNRLENTLNTLGTSTAKISDQVRKDTEAASALAAKIVERIVSQSTYNELVNKPSGMDLPEDHAVKNGIASAIASHVKFDISDALELAALILDEVNAHDEAAAVRKL